MPEKGTRQQKEEDQVPPPHQPCTDYELPKVECRTPLSPALQSKCIRRCCWKVPYKECKGVMKGKAPLSREREKGFLFQETRHKTRHSKTQQDSKTARHNTEEQDNTATSNNRQTRRCPWIGKMQSGDILYSIVPMQQLMGKQRNKVKKWKEKFFSFWNRKTYLRNMKQGPFTFLSFTSYTTYRERNKNIFKFCKKTHKQWLLYTLSQKPKRVLSSTKTTVSWNTRTSQSQSQRLTRS